jgi:hypothetical protein
MVLIIVLNNIFYKEFEKILTSLIKTGILMILSHKKRGRFSASFRQLGDIKRNKNISGQILGRIFVRIGSRKLMRIMVHFGLFQRGKKCRPNYDFFFVSGSLFLSLQLFV